VSAARAVLPAAGRATALAIQPGEEIAGAAGLRATRALAGEPRAQQLFPAGEPLIFSEEAVLRRAQQATERVPDFEVRRTERVGAGLVPPVEVRRTRTEPELDVDDSELETATLIREAERTRFEIQEGVLRPRVEFEGIRRDFGRRFEAGVLEDDDQSLEDAIAETERFRPEFAALETPRFETALESEMRIEADLARELEQVRELEAEVALETELRTEVEAEPFGLEPEMDEEEDRFGTGVFEGVRVVEAELEPREL